jgi:hypothetical protein
MTSSTLSRSSNSGIKRTAHSSKDGVIINEEASVVAATEGAEDVDEVDVAAEEEAHESIYDTRHDKHYTARRLE